MLINFLADQQTQKKKTNCCENLKLLYMSSVGCAPLLTSERPFHWETRGKRSCCLCLGWWQRESTPDATWQLSGSGRSAQGSCPIDLIS